MEWNRGGLGTMDRVVGEWVGRVCVVWMYGKIVNGVFPGIESWVGW